MKLKLTKTQLFKNILIPSYSGSNKFLKLHN